MVMVWLGIGWIEVVWVKGLGEGWVEGSVNWRVVF